MELPGAYIRGKIGATFQEEKAYPTGKPRLRKIQLRSQALKAI